MQSRPYFSPYQKRQFGAKDTVGLSGSCGLTILGPNFHLTLTARQHGRRREEIPLSTVQREGGGLEIGSCDSNPLQTKI